jgi:hypothetical protein
MSSYYQQWKQELNGQSLSDALFNDRYKDGFQVQKWRREPRASFDQVYLRGTGTVSLQGNDNWNFPETDRGAITFQVRNAPDQLMIDLGGYRSDIFGYVVVIGGDRSGVYRKYIQGTILAPWNNMPNYTYVPLSNVEYDRQFILPQAPINLWLVYDYGRITVGTGEQPDAGHVVLDTMDNKAAPGIQLVQFGVWSNSDDRESVVQYVHPWRKNGTVQPYQSPDYFTLLPPPWLKRLG